MRSIFFPIGVVILIALLMTTSPLTPVNISAQSPVLTPTVRAAIAAPRAGQYSVYLPLILGALPLAKKGVPLTYNDCASVTAMNAFWEFAWSPTPPNCTGVENVPMIWGAADMNIPVGGNSQWIMGFNEPDNAGQANLTPAQAATLWRQIEQKYPTRKLLSPASNGDIPTWFVDFRNAYISAYGTPPRLDGLGVHCYRWLASQCIPWIQQYETLANSWGIPEIWVTEFSFATTSPSSPSGSLQEQQTFINWMEGQSQVTRFSWFASKMKMNGTEWWFDSRFPTALVDYNTGQATSYGNVYLPYR
jgi:hypothetical protein